MKIVGLTGGVAMGKSTAVSMLRYRHRWVFDADACVADLYQHDRDLKAWLLERFPSAFIDQQLNHKALAKQIFSDPYAKNDIESYVHPLVHQMAMKFTARAIRHQERCVFWDVPLLFQSHLDQYCDAVMVVYCRSDIQKRRVLHRGWSFERYHQVVSAQMPIQQQMQLADYRVTSSLGKGIMRQQISSVMRKLYH